MIVTLAVHVFPEIDDEPSRLPTWNGFGGGAEVTAIGTVARLLVAEPSVAV